MGNHPRWEDLVGLWVHVRKGGRIIRTGQVDAVTFAADALWIQAHGAEPRALYEKAQGHSVLPVPVPTSGPLLKGRPGPPDGWIGGPDEAPAEPADSTGALPLTSANDSL